MRQIYNKNQRSALELTLLALFAVSLLTAAAITGIRNTIPMSKPIKLACASITASIPKGRQWVSFNQWRYNKARNNFVLASTIVQKEFTVAFAELTYILTPNTLDPAEHLGDNLTPGSQVIRQEVIKRDGIDILWCSVRQESIAGGIYLAAAKLDADRMLQIKVFAYRDEALAKKVFNVIMKSISFEKNQPLEDGLNFVNHLKEKKLPALIRNETSASMTRVYLVNKTESIDRKIPKQNIFDGFVIEHFSFNNDPEKLPLQCKSFFLTSAPNGAASDTLFQSDLSFDTFLWTARRTTSQGKLASETQIELEPGGLLSFTDILAEPTIPTLRPGPLAIPEILLDTVATEFLNFTAETIYLDLIFASGKILPVQLSIIKTENLNAKTKDIALAVKIHFLGFTDSSQTIYFDKNHKIVTKIEDVNVMVVGHRSNARNLINAFPEWTDHIKETLK